MGPIDTYPRIRELRRTSLKTIIFVALTSAFAGVAGISTHAIAQAATYQYDELGRLVEVSYPDRQVIRYQYDAAGNRTLVEQGGVPEPVNDAATTGEDAAKDIDVLSNDTDLNADPLTIATVGDPSHGTAEKVLVGGVDWVRYTPALNYNGADSFNYTVTDGTSQATANVSVTVLPGVDPPVAVDDTAATNEDTAKTINVLANDTDPDGDILSIQSLGAPSHGAAIISGTSVIYTPAANYFGSDIFTYSVTDGVLSDVGQVTITVNSVNDAPIAVNDSISTNEDTAKTFDPRINDSDAETPNTLLTIVSKTNGAHGTVTIVSGTQLTYTPSANYNGPDSFTYTLSDGALQSNVATVAVSVAAVDDPPTTPADFSKTILENWSGTVATLSSTDAEGQAITYKFATGGNPGNLFSIQGSSLVLSAAQNYEAPSAGFGTAKQATVKVYAVAGGLNSAVRTSVITLGNVDEAALAVSDSYTDVPVNTWTQMAVLANDKEDLPLTVQSASVAQGSVRVTSTGTAIEFNPGNWANVDFVISYTLRDGDGDLANGTVFARSAPSCPLSGCLPDF